MEYADFIRSKQKTEMLDGISGNVELNKYLKPFQRAITEWNLRRGRASSFAGTGLGKTLMELSWADAIVKHTNKPVIIFAPLAVAPQMVREASKFEVDDVRICRTHADVKKGINITNYQKIDPA